MRDDTTAVVGAEVVLQLPLGVEITFQDGKGFDLSFPGRLTLRSRSISIAWFEPFGFT